MAIEPEVSEFRVEKTRSLAVLTLSNGETVRGCFFVAGASARSAGPERVCDVLNAEPGFFPFEVRDDAGTRTVLYNRGQIVVVEVEDREARRDPGYDVATRRVVSVRLSTGLRVVGAVRVYRPEGRDRLSDWARQADQFRYVETDDTTLIVNVAHVIEVSEATES
ncbi:MAG: hypothetical protein ACHQO8_11065 [Vicinamibacterales bacterium]